MDDATNRDCRMVCGFGRGKRELRIAIWVNSEGIKGSQGPRRWEIAEFQASTPGCTTLECPFILPIHKLGLRLPESAKLVQLAESAVNFLTGASEPMAYQFCSFSQSLTGAVNRCYKKVILKAGGDHANQVFQGRSSSFRPED